ncbi:heat shock protein 15, partial [Escherichia coli 97.1742]
MKEKPAVEVRLDKWLWAARFYKTRALAREMIEGGKVHYNGQRSKPSKIVELNATLTLRQGNDERTVIVKAITEQRRPASEAALLYEETAESVEKREKNSLKCSKMHDNHEAQKINQTSVMPEKTGVYWN